MRSISTADWAMAFANKYPLALKCIWKFDLKTLWFSVFRGWRNGVLRTNRLKSYVDKTLMFLYFPFNIVAVNKSYFFELQLYSFDSKDNKWMNERMLAKRLRKKRMEIRLDKTFSPMQWIIYLVRTQNFPRC